MKRLLVFVIPVIILIAINTFGQGLGDSFIPPPSDEKHEFTGQLGATDQEADEGYFAIGRDKMIIAKPDSALHAYLRSHVGQRVKIVISPDTVSE